MTLFYFIDLTSLGLILRMAENKTNSTWLDPSFSLHPYIPLNLQTHTNALSISLFCLSHSLLVSPSYLFSLILSHLASYHVSLSLHHPLSFCPLISVPRPCYTPLLSHTLPFFLSPLLFFWHPYVPSWDQDLS